MRIFFFLILLLPLTVFAQEVKLLSWNVYMIPKPIRFSKQGTRTTQIRDQLSKLDHDVIILQEAFSAMFRHRVGRALKKTHPHRTILKRGGIRALNSGVFVLSRFPFKVIDKINYDECAEWDCFAGKGALLLEIQHPSGKKLQIAASHVQAESSEKAKAARWGQFEEIAGLLARHRIAGVPQILAGDLNVNALRPDADSEFNQVLKRLEMTTGLLSGGPGYTSSYLVECYQNDNGTSHSLLDHILLSQNGSNARVEDRRALPFIGSFGDKECPLSDHFGIEAVIKF